MTAHLRRWWLPYSLLWFVLASTTSLEGGQTTLAQGTLSIGLVLTAATGAALTLRRTGCALRRAGHQIHRRRAAAPR